jgi:Cu-Zn family superoxide dismutase
MYRMSTEEGFPMPGRRSIIAATASLAVLAMLTAGVAAGGATHAAGTFVNAEGQSIGWVRLVEDGAGIVHVNVHVAGLTPGLHGIHIHAIGACSPTFAAAGGHYNPLGHEHGLENVNGAHAGDLPNLIVNANGVAHLDTTTDGVTITAGPTTLFDTTAGAVGSAFIIHANEDDQVTNATNGNSGARVACAVIEAG